MKQFNIARNNETIIYGVRIPKGAIYGKINGVFYYITDTKLQNGGVMSYIVVRKNGKVILRNNVHDNITIFVSEILEKHKIRGTGVLYDELQEKETLQKKQSNSKPNKETINQIKTCLCSVCGKEHTINERCPIVIQNIGKIFNNKYRTFLIGNILLQCFEKGVSFNQILQEITEYIHETKSDLNNNFFSDWEILNAPIFINYFSVSLNCSPSKFTITPEETIAGFLKYINYDYTDDEYFAQNDEKIFTIYVDMDVDKDNSEYIHYFIQKNVQNDNSVEYCLIGELQGKDILSPRVYGLSVCSFSNTQLRNKRFDSTYAIQDVSLISKGEQVLYSECAGSLADYFEKYFEWTECCEKLSCDDNRYKKWLELLMTYTKSNKINWEFHKTFYTTNFDNISVEIDFDTYQCQKAQVEYPGILYINKGSDLFLSFGWIETINMNRYTSFQPGSNPQLYALIQLINDMNQKGDTQTHTCPICNTPLDVVHTKCPNGKTVDGWICNTCLRTFYSPEQYKILSELAHSLQRRLKSTVCRYEIASEISPNTHTTEQKAPDYTQINIHSLIVLKNTLKCSATHQTEDINAMLPLITRDGQVEYKKMLVSYCHNCKRYTMLKNDFERIKDLVMCKIVDETKTVSHQHTNTFDINAGTSLLYSYGYNVQAQRNLSTAQRHAILEAVLEAKIMTKRQIIDHIDILINRGSKIPSWHLAVEKWCDDKQFVRDYEIGTLKEVNFDQVILKYTE